MKVKIGYTVELDAVPKEVQALIESKIDLDGFYNSLEEIKKNLLINNKYPEAILSIDRLRSNLIDVDLILADCTMILQGYVENVSKLTLPTSSSEPMENNGEIKNE